MRGEGKRTGTEKILGSRGIERLRAPSPRCCLRLRKMKKTRRKGLVLYLEEPENIGRTCDFRGVKEKRPREEPDVSSLCPVAPMPNTTIGGGGEGKRPELLRKGKDSTKGSLDASQEGDEIEIFY